MSYKYHMSNLLPLEFANWAMRRLLAQGVIAVFLLLNVVSFSLPHAGDFKPFFLLMAVYYWAIYRPTLIPVYYTFVLGLVMDLLSGMPPGLTSLVMVALQTLVQKSRLFLMGQPYIMVWIGFSIMALANAFCLWLVLSIKNGLMPVTPTLVAALLSTLLFPVASLILLGVHKLLPVSSTPMRTVR